MESADPDAGTAARAAAGDGPAFRALVDAWRGRVAGFCWRMCGDAALAEDLSQEVFLHLYQALRRYDPSRPFAPWMRRVTANCVLNRLRARPPRALSLEGASGEPLPVADPRSPDPAAAAAAAEDAERLRRCLVDLPEGWRAVVALRYTEGLSVEEIGASLDLPVNTVKTRLFRARAALREALSREGEGAGGGRP
ncbi:MAG: sigma-70 family RNA polymerase sigma factor [Planctomycetes bacterium]|nr:sigma-70 family RNA polymerase sigma factor [Planctomycetota bacterium]